MLQAASGRRGLTLSNSLDGAGRGVVPVRLRESSGAVRVVPVCTVRAYLNQLAENLAKLSPAEHQKRKHLLSVFLAEN